MSAFLARFNLIWIATFTGAFFPVTAQAFAINLTDCAPYSSETVYQLRFDQYALSPHYSVKVSAYESSPDVRIRLTDDPREADLLIVDDLDGADMSICNKPYATDALIIRATPYVISPDIRIQMSNQISDPDYTLYVLSDEITAEEGAAFFIVLWANQ